MSARFCLQRLLDEQVPPMNQSELARNSGVSLVTINAIANNRTTQVHLETLDRIAAALDDVAPGDLIESDRPTGARARGVRRRAR